jgi:hypothetical protein
VFLDGVWFIDLNGNGRWDSEDLWVRLGGPDDLPVVGDWDGDGKDDLGVFGPAWQGDVRAIRREPGLPDAQNRTLGRPKNVPPEQADAPVAPRVMRRTSQGKLRSDVIDHVFRYGSEGDLPVVGDWNGDGVKNIGLYRHGTWYLDVDGDGVWSDGDRYIEHFGGPDDLPVVGDWDGDGVDEIGIYSAGVWRLDSNHNYQLDDQDRSFRFGGPDDLPVVGDWDGDGVDEVAVYRRGKQQPEQKQAQAAPGQRDSDAADKAAQADTARPARR